MDSSRRSTWIPQRNQCGFLRCPLLSQNPKQVQAAAFDLDGSDEDITMQVQQQSPSKMVWAGRSVTFMATLEVVASQQLIKDMNLNSDADVAANTSRTLVITGFGW